MSTNKEIFFERRKEFESNKKPNVAMKLDYLISQVNTLFEIVNESNPMHVNSITTVNNEVVDANPVEPAKDILDKIIEDAANITPSEETYTIEPVDLIEEEIKSWGVSLEYIGAKMLMEIPMKCTNGAVNSKMSYDEICNALYDDRNDINLFKRSITFIRKKANFKKSKYIPVFHKMKPEKITNELLLKNIIEFCE